MCALAKEKAIVSIFILLLMFLGNILKNYFLNDGRGEDGELSTSILIQEMGCGIKPNRIIAYGESIFDFLCDVINVWPLIHWLWATSVLLL